MPLGVIKKLKPNTMRDLVETGIIHSKENTERAKRGVGAIPVGNTKLIDYCEHAALDAIRMKKRGHSDEKIKEHLDSLLEELGYQIYEQYRFQQQIYYQLSDLAYRQIGMLAPSTA